MAAAHLEKWRIGVNRSLVVAVAMTLAWVMTTRPARADGTSPCDQPGADYCIGNSPGPTTPPTGTGSGGGGGVQGPTEPPPCGWEDVPASVAVPWISSGGVENGAPPVGVTVTWQAWCFNEASAGAPYGGPFRWIGPASVVKPVDVAQGLYEQMQGRMPTPVVETNPQVGTASIVNVPVFVFVSNWQSAFTVHQDLGGVPVTVTATPQLVFDSGEIGSGAEQCNGAGRRYDPNGGALAAQAAVPGACTHIYTHRTGVEGRPNAWPGTVTVQWTITWAAGDGSGGGFPLVNRTIAVPRSVDEVQSVVVPGG